VAHWPDRKHKLDDDSLECKMAVDPLKNKRCWMLDKLDEQEIQVQFQIKRKWSFGGEPF
jgi:hypothetical protein